MRYENIVEGVFLSRPNRFVANVKIDGKEETVHVKNTGRLKELLYEGVRVVCQRSENVNRKTKFDLISVYKGDVLYNIDSVAPNIVFGEYIEKFFTNVKKVKPEKKYKNSRFDFYVEYEDKRAFVEVKGVTLEKDGVMLFPDAPTQRGVKHINELTECVKDGFEAYIVFVICADTGFKFSPNEERHKEFAEALRSAEIGGVKISALKCNVGKDSINIKEFMDVEL